ncbi:MAG TPA: carboxypeptidase-like regulatory domain-containing protein [Longimicrobium sp.]|nr:carboxypeptidase-like regulatory domain-containing protein [Longimicrobium sp.]
MSALPVVGRRRHTATVVLRPVDALREALRRPPHERGPVARVRLRVAGRVQAGQVRPLAPGQVHTVRNLSGDTVLVDFRLPAGRYRIELERDPRERRDAFYEALDAAQRDLVWDPDAPPPGLPDGTPHPSRLVVLRLRPSALYPFPAGSTLVRGALLWYDGAPLDGAAVSDAAALVDTSRVDGRGSFALAFPAPSASGPATLQLDTGGVAAAAKPSGAAYLAGWPAQVATQWRRGETVSVAQPSLAGVVLGPEGRPLPGATVTVVGRPGALATGAGGEWRYHFPPGTAGGSVDVVVQHPDHAAVQLSNVPFAAGAASRAPVVRMN